MRQKKAAEGSCRKCQKTWQSETGMHCTQCCKTYYSETAFVTHRKKCGQVADCTCRKAACKEIYKESV